MDDQQPEVPSCLDDFAVLISSDGNQYYVQKNVVQQSDEFHYLLKSKGVNEDGLTKLNINLKGDVLEVLIQYLHFQAENLNHNFDRNPMNFNIHPELALDVLKASLDFKL